MKKKRWKPPKPVSPREVEERIRDLVKRLGVETPPVTVRHDPSVIRHDLKPRPRRN